MLKIFESLSSANFFQSDLYISTPDIAVSSMRYNAALISLASITRSLMPSTCMSSAAISDNDAMILLFVWRGEGNRTPHIQNLLFCAFANLPPLLCVVSCIFIPAHSFVWLRHLGFFSKRLSIKHITHTTMKITIAKKMKPMPLTEPFC